MNGPLACEGDLLVPHRVERPLNHAALLRFLVADLQRWQGMGREWGVSGAWMGRELGVNGA